MKRLLDRFQNGVVSGYVIGLVVMAAVLFGGVLILKNAGGDKSGGNNQPVAVQTNTEKQSSNAENSKTSDQADSESVDDTDKTNDAVETDQTTTTSTTTTTNSDLTATGSNSDYTPGNLAQTGPADTLAAILGLVFAGAGIYAVWHYRESRLAVTRKLLEK